MDLELGGRIVLVSGSNRGTGAVIAAAFAAEGAAVLVHGMAEGDAEEVTASIQADGGRAMAIAGDLTTDAGADQAAAACSDIDILVNNYGTAERGRWFGTDSAAWLDMYQKNVLSAARLIGRLVPAMKARGWGRIVQLGTVGSTRPNARNPHYYAAKGALATLAVSLAKELSGTGITVNTVSPGLILTAEVEAQYRRMAAKNGWGDDWAEIERRIATEISPNPLGRIARREEIADLVLFLASPRAGYINGQNIRIDGGALDVVE